MKKVLNIFALTTITIVLSACQKEEGTTPVNNGPKKIHVTFSDLATKSALGGDSGKDVLWETGDAICIYDGIAQNKFTYTSGNSFDGEVAEDAEYFAYYPDLQSQNQSVAKTSDDPLIFITYLPSYQKVRPNSIFQGAIISACKPELNGDQLTGVMQNLTSFIKFTISDATNNPISKIRFSTPGNSRFMSGQCKLVFDEGNISLSTDSYKDKSYSTYIHENSYVECGPASGDSFSNGTYYVSVLPANVPDLTITLYAKNGKVYEYAASSVVNFVRNEVFNVGTIDSKIASEGGLTGKLSIMVDFVNQHVSGCPTSADDAVHPITVSANGTTYSMSTYNFYVKANQTDIAYFASNSGKKAYLQTPAMEGKTLKEVTVTWRGHGLNSSAQASIKSVADDAYYSGIYYCNKQIDRTNNQKYFTLPVIGGGAAKPLYVSHRFVLGKVSFGENSGGNTAPAENTSYILKGQGTSLTSLVEYIHLVYE